MNEQEVSRLQLGLGSNSDCSVVENEDYQKGVEYTDPEDHLRMNGSEMELDATFREKFPQLKMGDVPNKDDFCHLA